jgi:hypothetical protein
MIVYSKTYGQNRIGVLLNEPEPNSSEHVVIRKVYPNSKAEKAGLQVGDTILRFDNIYINSNQKLITQIQTIVNEDPVPIEVTRTGGVHVLMVSVELPRYIPIIVERKSSDFGALINFWVYINDVNVGKIGILETNSPKEFSFQKPLDDEARIYIKCFGAFNITTISDTLVFRIKERYKIVATFKPKVNGFPITITYPLADYVVDSLRNASIQKKMNRIEANNHNRLTSENAVAPRFFKNTVERSLQGKVATKIRGNFLSSILQCRSIYRLLALFLLTVFMCGFLRNKLWYLAPLMGIGLFLVSWPLSAFLNVIFFDGPRYFPREVIFFFLMALLLIVVIGMTMSPLVRILTHKVETWKKLLGWFGTVLTLYEIVKAIIELCNDLKPIW